jgi:arsenite methyltransferase
VSSSSPTFTPTGGCLRPCATIRCSTANASAAPSTGTTSCAWHARPALPTPRLVSDRPLAITDPELAARTGAIRFFSATYRLFSIPELEDACEDHGQAVIYRGTIVEHPHALPFDKHHWIEAGKVFPVCGNTFRMLAESRLAPHFAFIGDFSRHYGLFEGCGTAIPFESSPLENSTAAAPTTSTNSGSCC